jgi:hypothetical protein
MPDKKGEEGPEFKPQYNLKREKEKNYKEKCNGSF